MIELRCTRCRSTFLGSELTSSRSPCCPQCGRILTDDWGPLLLDEVARAEIALRHLTAAANRIRSLPGHLELLPHPTVYALARALGCESGTEGISDDQRQAMSALGACWGLDHPPARPVGRLRALIAPPGSRASARYMQAVLAPVAAAGGHPIASASRRKRNQRRLR